MFIALLMALFLPDMWVILNQADNSVLDVLLTLVRQGWDKMGQTLQTRGSSNLCLIDLKISGYPIIRL